MMISTSSEQETYQVGFSLGQLLSSPLTVVLSGDLGTGKTVFAKGALAGLGISQRVRSPSFNLMHVYEGRLPVYHFDFYRLEAEEELLEIGFPEYLVEGIVFIEWGDKFPMLLPQERIEVSLEGAGGDKTIDLNQRKIHLIPFGKPGKLIMEKLYETIKFNDRGHIQNLDNTEKEEGGEKGG